MRKILAIILLRKTRNEKRKTHKKAHGDHTPWALVSQPLFRLEVEQTHELDAMAVAEIRPVAAHRGNLEIIAPLIGILQAELDGGNGPEP